MTASLTRIAAIAFSPSLFSPAILAQDKNPEAAAEGRVTGNPPPDHPFAKIKPGMKFDEVVAILGKPTSERAYCTGKHAIPFSFGNDKARTNQHFKGQGIVIFFSDFSAFGFGRHKSCSAKEPLKVAEVHYDANETGVADEGEDAKKEPAQAAK